MNIHYHFDKFLRAYIAFWHAWRFQMLGGAFIVLLTSIFIAIWIFTQPLQPLTINIKERAPSTNTTAFTQPPEAYNDIGKYGFEGIEQHILEVPDLRHELIYYGSNDRPDKEEFGDQFFFALRSTNMSITAPAGKPIYLLALPNKNYQFSENNAPTALKILVSNIGPNRISVVVQLKDNSESVQFELAAIVQRPTNNAATDDGLKFDPTLLTRQQVRWYGKDCFLEHFGGDSHKQLAAKQRIELTDSNNASYVIYAGPSDCFFWNGSRWQNAPPGPQTRNHYLIQVRDIEDRVIHFNAWDRTGQIKMPVAIMRLHENWNPTQYRNKVRLIGVRSATAAILQIESKRYPVKPGDWILHTDKNWKILTSLQEVDDYISGQRRGMLLVFTNLHKQDGRWHATANFFSPNHSEMQEFDLDVSSPANSSPNTPPPSADNRQPPPYYTPPGFSPGNNPGGNPGGHPGNNPGPPPSYPPGYPPNIPGERGDN